LNKMLKSKKGATLVTVVIIVTVLVLLCSILMDIILNNLVLTKRHMNIDFAYYAGESAIENWFSVINSQLKGGSITSSYPGDVTLSESSSRKAYADHIVQKIKEADALKDLWIDVSNKSDKLVATAASDTSAHVEFIDIVLEDTKWDSSMGNSIEIYIAIKAKSSFSLPGTSYKTGNKEVYAIESFRVQCPTRDFLESAIWAVGDFYINGNNEGKTATVNGDVFTFGSYGVNTNDMRQELFGGIYAINGGMLNIYGNAYSRSFIRTGPYPEPGIGNIDNSEIRIYKDAIAQCIQAFGDGDKIIGLRNAYTFDDIEINGENSVIAINGSFFGLKRGGENSNHDESSAIVNSTLLHSINRHGGLSGGDPTFKSRVVINGDVIIGGSTMKIGTKDDGSTVVQGPIENASLAFDTNGIPFYKSFDWDNREAVKYHDELRKAFEDGTIMEIGASMNIFQLWNILDPFDSAQVSTWIANIDKERNDVGVSFDNTKSGDRRGWWGYEIIGNKNLYQNNQVETDIKHFANDYFVGKNTSIGTYRLDNVFNNDGTIKYGKDEWIYNPSGSSKDLIVHDGEEIPIINFLFGTVDIDVELKGICTEIKEDLEAKVNKFVSRNYADSGWNVEPTDKFHKILVALKSEEDGVSGEDRNHIIYIAQDDGLGGSPEVPIDIKKLFNDKRAISDIYSICAADRVEEYYIIANANPNVHLEISGAFNGIIVTAGKIHLKDNANVYGSIIAAGAGEYNDYNGNVISDANGDPTFFPRAKAVSHDEVNNLDNGEYAAVTISINDDDGNGEIIPPYVDFYLGLAGDVVSEYTKDGLQNVVDIAVSVNGYFKPEDPDETDDLIYLNRAARVNLLEKFTKWGINLYDIF